MTIQELQARQGWTLTQKIDHTVGAIEAFINQAGAPPYVSFSGGRDSTVLLNITRRFVNRDIKAVYCNTGNEWPEIIRFVRQTENVTIIQPEMTVKQVLDKYGFPLISKEQSSYIRECRTTNSEALRDKRLNGKNVKGAFIGKISDRWKFLVEVPFMTSEKCCECLKKRPFRKYEKETGEVPIIGIMADESDLRKHQYIKRGGCNSFKGRLASFPVSIWTGKNGREYIHKYKIPYSPIYDIPGVEQTGCMFCGFGAHLEKGFSRFGLLNDLHPKAYQHFMNYTNNGITYREALRRIGVELPDEKKQLKLF